MALDPSARKANVKDSIKDYLLDNIETISGITVSFDSKLSTPNLKDKSVDRWVSVLLGEMDRKEGVQFVDLYCCTRNDNEGFKLAQLTDTVLGYLTDTSMSDSMARVPLYRSSATEAWTQIGTMVVLIDGESPEMEAEDETNFCVIHCRFRWGTIF